jgi:hypothetical protein
LQLIVGQHLKEQPARKKLLLSGNKAGLLVAAGYLN